MNSAYRTRLCIAALAAFSVTAHAQQPPDVVQSDGNQSTAMGTNALLSALGAQRDTAAGFGALSSNTTGADNTAVGSAALLSNTQGSFNSVLGSNSLSANTTGNGNSAFGNETLTNNTTGFFNTGLGAFSLIFSTGNYNTAAGANSLAANTSGSNNTAMGYQALSANTTGANNIAIGYFAGDLVSGSENIDIGNQGVASDSGTIRIGTSGSQKHVFIAGINSSQVTGSAVYVTAAGKLGVLASSERYKTAISPMGDTSEKLQQLRPVTFHLKTEPHGALQYGLIAEEVSRVYPDLVIRDEAGTVQGVRYDELAPLLLNELQKQKSKMALQAQQLHAQDRQLQQLQQRVTQLAQKYDAPTH
ncbi:MAG: tail fiber domain-containing protein [Proteobacteria bacterium]|nr:tail fiber domain-containing protein [Pseudomonadota bacterium]